MIFYFTGTGNSMWTAKTLGLFLLKLRVDMNSYCFVVMTSNNGKSGKAVFSIDHALQKYGAKLSSSFNLQMPGNCIESTELVMRVYTGVLFTLHYQNFF